MFWRIGQVQADYLKGLFHALYFMRNGIPSRAIDEKSSGKIAGYDVREQLIEWTEIAPVPVTSFTGGGRVYQIRRYAKEFRPGMHVESRNALE
jgi:hypothetical protein